MTRAYTVSPWGFDMEVLAEVDPGERPTIDHPGCAPYCVIEAVKIGAVDVYYMLDDAQLQRIEAAVLRSLDL